MPTPSKLQQLSLDLNLKEFSIREENSPYIKDNLQLDPCITSTTPRQRYSHKFMALVPDFSNLDESRAKWLAVFASHLDRVERALSPLESLGIGYNLTLAGGSVRDWVLGQCDLIEDLDIFLEIFPRLQNFSPTHLDSQKNPFDFSANQAQSPADSTRQRNTVFTREELNFLIGTDTVEAEKLSFNTENVCTSGWEVERDLVIRELIKKEFKIDEFYPRNRVEKRYSNQFIESIFKLSGEVNLDLIVCRTQNLSVAETFDFELCKTYINYKSIPTPGYQKKMAPVVQQMRQELAELERTDAVTRVIGGFRISHSCLKDMYDKTITLRAHHFSQPEIEYFMNKHYRKLKKKFTNFKFTVRSESLGHTSLPVQQLAQIIEQQIALDEVLSTPTLLAKVQKI